MLSATVQLVFTNLSFHTLLCVNRHNLRQTSFWLLTCTCVCSILIIFFSVVQLDLPSSIRIQGGHLSAEYRAAQLHLHWGKGGGPGSEHTIDGEQFPMEVWKVSLFVINLRKVITATHSCHLQMHIVHMKEEYSSLSEAVKDSTGVAVLGFLFQVTHFMIT